eukprot:276173_1
MSRVAEDGSPSKTPTKLNHTQDAFELPDTPTSLASSYNQDVIYPLQSPNKSMRSIRTESADFTKRIKYNPLHDSIESFISDRISAAPHNTSLLNDFQDLKLLIDDKKKTDDTANIIPTPSPQQHDNGGDLVQKWLQDRQRWDTITATYEQKVNDIQNKLKSKTASLNKKIDSMTKQELKYKAEIRHLTQQIDSLKSIKNEQYIKLDHDHQELSETNRELTTKYQNLQDSLREQETTVLALQQKLSEKDQIISKLEADHKTMTERDMGALNTKHVSEIKIKTKQLNDDLMNATKENERLKQLELTSQNMVERLLKRLEQQIHSSENAQQQLNFKEKEHDEEIMRLEQINSKLQKHLTVFSTKQNQNHVSPSSPCSESSESSLFTLSTVQTDAERQPPQGAKQKGTKWKSDNKLIDALKKENVSLKQTINKFREMLNIDGNSGAEWIQRTKEFAKQTVLIEKLKNEITTRDDMVNQSKHSITQYETVIADHKETIQKLKNRIDDQMNGIAMLEKSNSDISMQVIEERTMRQKVEKEIEDLQFENKQLRNKLIAFKQFASRTLIGTNTQSDGVEAEEDDDEEEMARPSVRPASANNVMNSLFKDKLLLDSLRHLLDKYENDMSDDDTGFEQEIMPRRRYSHGAQRPKTSSKKARKQKPFNTPKSMMSGRNHTFMQRTMSRLNVGDHKKKSRAVPYVEDEINHHMIPKVSIRKRRKSNYRKRSISMPGQPVSVYRNRKPKSAKSKLAKGGSAKNKKRKRYALKACIHNKQWM